MTSNNTSSGGISFAGLLAIVFITLKLCEVTVVATWSWWWVLSPLWIPVVLAVIIGIFAIVIYEVLKNK